MSKTSRLTCAECPSFLWFREKAPRKQHGIILRPGERYCLGGECPCRFRPGDPKVYPAKWCPRRIYPYIFRVYSENIYMEMYTQGKKRRVSQGEIKYPNAYTLVHEGTAHLSGKDVLEILRQRRAQDILEGLPDVEEILERRFFRGDILEFDDGLKPMFYLATWKGIRQVTFEKEWAKREKVFEIGGIK